MSNFSPELIFQKLNGYMSQDKEQQGLVYLYETLINELKNVENCNNFLIFAVTQKMNSDIIVHILNALSSIKLKLEHWTKFREYCLSLLTKEIGSEQTNILIKALDSV